MRFRLSSLLPLTLLVACNQDQTGVEVLDTNFGQPSTPDGTLLPTPSSVLPQPNMPVTEPGLVSCATDAECVGVEVCSAGYCLVPCTTNEACAPTGLVCDTAASRCVQCVADANCTGGMICNDGACVAGTPAMVTVPEPAADDVPPEPAATPEPVPADDDDVVVVDTDAGVPAVEPSGDAGMSEPEPEETVVEADPEPMFDENGCIVAGTYDPCRHGLPTFVGEQTVDADGADFCAVPPAVLELATSPLTIGDTVGLPHRAEVRLAWTPDALHVFATVTDPAVLPEAPKDTWSGDSLDVYVASSADVSGNLGDDGTPQVILAPPSPDGSRAASAMSFPAQEELSSGYAAMTGGDGYVVELSFPWPGGATKAVGDKVRLNFGMNVREQECTDFSDLNSCRQYYGAFTDAFPGGSSSCEGFSLLSGGDAEPWCDNRTWCEVTLE